MICASAFLKRRQDRHPASGEAQLLHDILWAHSKPEYGLQHIRVKAEDDGLVLTLFFQGTDTVEASAHTDRLVHSARRSPLLTAYHWSAVPSESQLG